MALIKVQCTEGDTSTPSAKRINIQLNDDIILAVINGQIIFKEKYEKIEFGRYKLSNFTIVDTK